MSIMPTTGRRARPHSAGYTLVEILVVLVIIATLAAIGVPRMTRERTAASGQDFAQLVTRELQRARLEAISTRMPQYAFLFADRIELRSARPGATPTAPLVAPTATDPALRVVRARPGINMLDVTNLPVTPSAQLSTAVSKQVVFSTIGTGFIGPAAPAVPAPVYVYLENSGATSGHPDRQFRVEVAALTGFIRMGTTWP